MKTIKAAGKSKRAPKGMGRLYIRGKDRKEYPAGTPNVEGGAYWLAYLKPTGATDANGKPVKKKTRVSLKDADGNSITTKKEAEEAQKRIIHQYVATSKEEQLISLKAKIEEATEERVKAVEEANPPLAISEAWESYRDNPKADLTSNIDTLKGYIGYWKAFSEWLGERNPHAVYLRDVTDKDAETYSKHLRKQLARGTYNKQIRFLRSLFTVVAKDARIAENPFEGILTIDKEEERDSRRALSVEELRTILERAEGELATLLFLGTFLGLRLGDCCTLSWSECNLAKGLVFRKTNKAKKRVSVGIPAPLMELLLQTPASNRKGYIVPDFAGRYTYRNATGATTQRGSITDQVQKHLGTVCGIRLYKEGTGKTPEYLEKLKQWEQGGCKGKKPTYKRAVVEVGFHSLRHSYVSLQAATGTPQAVVQKLVGHGSPAMTEHYTHLEESTVLQAARSLDHRIIDADFEEVRTVSPWIREALGTATAHNWQDVINEVLGGA
ncbi:Putative defective protein IntQ [Pontiella desulfatans]|uniref:Defective protein IntQ n=1 Tax=Pontiella desulfatans TaxID=2750659 RepID=A0A6C2U700_PONDE|nr:tyrosine-type recombinase/integrase [Pontiella desulfatans]VGO15683.1 Putative defective protein IntQ [Pontiella desulfatans]